MIKTHTFKLGKFWLEIVHRIDGITEIPDTDSNPTQRKISIVNNHEYRFLSNALHEALHADGYPDELLHKKDGTSDTERIAKFLWRLGYRRKNK